MDNINHPIHYENSCSMECIDVMEMIFGVEGLEWFCLMNVFKYMWRWKNKNGVEDLDKADWYLKKFNTVPTTNQRLTMQYNCLYKMMRKFREEIDND